MVAKRTWTIPGVVARVHDGDTVEVDGDLGWDITLRIRARILHINAPELATADGKDARAYAMALLPPGARVTLTSYGWDKYGGRTDATLLLDDGRDFGVVMVTTGHAVPYEGGAR